MTFVYNFFHNILYIIYCNNLSILFINVIEDENNIDNDDYDNDDDCN